MEDFFIVTLLKRLNIPITDLNWYLKSGDRLAYCLLLKGAKGVSQFSVKIVAMEE